MFALTAQDIEVTPAAIAYLRQVAAGVPATGFRLRLLGGKGCGGSAYDLSPVLAGEEAEGDDFLSLEGGLTLFISPADALKLFGCCVDYIEDDLGNRRIDIRNPNETGRCGCGKSVTF